MKLLSLSLLLAAITVVVLGAYTRLADAGLGCPDWPTCYGHLWVPNSDSEIQKANERFAETPVETHKTWPEQIHRIFASSLGVLILITFALLNFRRTKTRAHKQINSVSIMLMLLVGATVLRVIFGHSVEVLVGLIVFLYFANVFRIARVEGFKADHDNYVLASVLAGLVILQGLFGMWTVTLKLWPQVVTAHLLGGFATLSLIALLFKQSWFDTQSRVYASGKLVKLVYLVFALIVLQITLGGWMSSNYAALACPDLPLCQNAVVPPMDFRSGFNVFQHVGPNYLYGKLDNEARTAIHFSHRVGAIVVTLAMLTLLVSLIRTGQALAKKYAVALSLILLTQLSLGISNIAFALPISVAVLHNAVGAALLICTIYLMSALSGSSEANKIDR